MGVMFQPIDHHEASLELAPLDWRCKLQPSATTTTLALSPCPLLSLQDILANSDSGMFRQPGNSQTSVLQITNPRKRWASVRNAPCRGVKRQRVAVKCKYQSTCWDSAYSASGSVGSPRSLQYALPDLSSYDTMRVLHAMHAMPSELRHLNGSASRSHLRQHSKVRQVFGWRHLLCHEEEDEYESSRVVWKSAKALDSTRMRPLARQIWRASTERETGKVLYTVNSIARIVRSTKRQVAGCRRDQIWLECYLDDGLQICVARKELRQFNDHRSPDSSATECQGFLVRPVFTKAINSRVAGCSLQCLRAMDARDCGVRSAPALKQKLIEDLPSLTLQWEEAYLCDLVQAPQVLLDSVFAHSSRSH